MSKVLRVDNSDNGNFGSAQFVETRVILPSSQSNEEIRWLLPQAGIMAGDAFIQLQVIGADGASRLPLWSGCMSVVRSARLQYDGQVIATSRGINHLFTLKNFYRDPHNRNEKQSIRYGSFTGLMVDETAAAPGPVRGGHWGIDVGTDYCNGAVAGDTRTISTGYRITNAAATSPEWRIYLSDLFPIIYNNGLPLGLLEGQFTVILELEQDQVRGQRVVAPGGAWVTGSIIGGGVGPAGTPHAGLRIGQPPRLHVDLTFYDDPPGVSTMENLKEDLDRGEVIPYTDYHYVQQKQPLGVADTVFENNVLLGLDHQVVRRIFVATPNEQNYGAPTTSASALLGNYFSEGSNHKNTLNLKINAKPIYPQALDGDNKTGDQLSQCFPEPFKQNSAVMSATGQVATVTPFAYAATQQRVTNKTLDGIAQTDFQNKCHYYGINLSKTYANVLGAGTPIGRQACVLTLTDFLVAGNLGPKTLHIFAEAERALAIKNGTLVVTGS